MIKVVNRRSDNLATTTGGEKLRKLIRRGDTD